MANDKDESAPQPAAAPAAPEAAPAAQSGAPQFGLQRVYLKDTSFESPRTPAIFLGQWKPNISFDLKTRSSRFQDDTYEAVLQLTVEAKMDEQAAFVAEVHQAGVFTMRGFSEAQIEQLTATMCPSILFPYAREALDGLVVKGGFPALMLAPINFDVLYAQRKQQDAEGAGKAAEGKAPEGAGDAPAGAAAAPEAEKA